MASSALLIWVPALVFAFLLVPSCGYLSLREGEKCGEWISGSCENGLVCVPTEPSTEFYAVGECTRLSNCNCSEIQCPPRRRNVMCHGFVSNPCGCCYQCGRRVGQVCGGPSWRYGNCIKWAICTLVVGLDTVRSPQMGVCKELPNHLSQMFSTVQCPVQYGCNVHVGNCDCYSDDSCHASFSYRNYEDCNKVLIADRMYDVDNPEPEPELEPERVCIEWSCEVQGCECVCKYRKCNKYYPLYEDDCCKILKKSGCQNATCPEIPPPDCPGDSFLSEPYTEPGQCCPAVPAMCTCNFKVCTPKPQYCTQGGFPILVAKGNGYPGTCCDRYECVKEEE